MTTRERIVLDAHLLVSIDAQRRRRKAPHLFYAVEQEILWRDLADLEQEWLANPPAPQTGQPGEMR